jgi:hypothetical protein
MLSSPAPLNGSATAAGNEPVDFWVCVYKWTYRIFNWDYVEAITVRVRPFSVFGD